ncbi:MAG: DUF4091 domain-containing protein [Bryobacterales bacterium]|nr:DUF4091 domain-containing protein [Bryobacterales bacterium]
MCPVRLAGLLLLGSLLVCAAPKIAVWQVDSLIKVFPDDNAGTNQASRQPWAVPRNGHASLQFAVRPADAVENFQVTVELRGGLKTTVRRVGYVPVRSDPPKSPADELIRSAPGRFPDPLFEETSFRLPGKETTAVWITVFAPAGTQSGAYSGRAVFKAGKQKVATLPFEIRVAKATVPEQTLRVTNWFTFDEERLGRYYDLDGSPDRYWEVLRNIARVIGEHRQNVILTPVLDLTAARATGGSVSYDFSRLDRFIEIFEKAGAAGVIEGGHLLSRASGYNSPLTVPAFIIEGGEVKRAALDPGDPRAEAHVNSFLPALYAHLKEKGRLDRYVQHVLDEAHGAEPPVYMRYVELVRKTMPGVKTIDAIDQTAGLLGEACDIWVPQLGRFDDAFDAIRRHVEKGGQAWYYTCLYPQGRHLNRFIQQPLVKARLLHWFNFRYGFTGFLHWGGNYWPEDPYADTQPIINAGHDLLPAGDAFVTYPWKEGKSIHSSIRFEAMMEGIEDYELLRAAAVRNEEKAGQLARSAIPGLTSYVRDAAAFRKLQAELLATAE